MVRLNGKGRPSIDWAALFHEWVKSRKRKAEFLRSKGIDPGSGSSIRNTRDWTMAAKGAAAIVQKAAEPVIEDTINELWQIVQQWRRKQAEFDYKTADNVRLHVQAILREKISQIVDPETGKTVARSKLKASELMNLTRALESVQRIQRLALGMSTENIGVDRIDPDTHVEKQEPDDQTGPVFIVEVNKNGRFIRPRPRQVS
jgi:hypothetical protein